MHESVGLEQVLVAVGGQVIGVLQQLVILFLGLHLLDFGLLLLCHIAVIDRLAMFHVLQLDLHLSHQI